MKSVSLHFQAEKAGEAERLDVLLTQIARHCLSTGLSETYVDGLAVMFDTEEAREHDGKGEHNVPFKLGGAAEVWLHFSFGPNG